MAKHKIDGTHIPTKTPSSLKPINQRYTDKRKLKKDKITG
jgi:hypothetical protein